MDPTLLLQTSVKAVGPIVGAYDGTSVGFPAAGVGALLGPGVVGYSVVCDGKGSGWGRGACSQSEQTRRDGGPLTGAHTCVVSCLASRAAERRAESFLQGHSDQHDRHADIGHDFERTEGS
jgi:hypothetical protein